MPYNIFNSANVHITECRVLIARDWTGFTGGLTTNYSTMSTMKIDTHYEN